jgi:hypothetical protein
MLEWERGIWSAMTRHRCGFQKPRNAAYDGIILIDPFYLADGFATGEPSANLVARAQL